jgi:hypothetical protein
MMRAGEEDVGSREQQAEVPRAARRLPRLGLYPAARRLSWELGLKVMEAVAGHRRGDHPDFRLRHSARDLLW